MIHLGIERALPQIILAQSQAVRRWVLSNNHGTTHNMCNDAAARLCSQLDKLGYKTEFMLGWFYVDAIWHPQHCWVRVNRLHLDVTGDQFNDDLESYKQDLQVREIVFGSLQDLHNRYRLSQN
jgi:hypothetical protein